MLRSVGASLSARVARPAAPPSDPALERLARRTPRYAVATLDAWMALERRVSDKRRAERRAKREQKEQDEALRRAGKNPKPAATAPDDDSGLSPLMESEAMSWIDGKTTAAEIARRVCAEALSAGRWYYGNATPALVEKFLERQATDGLIAW